MGREAEGNFGCFFHKVRTDRKEDEVENTTHPEDRVEHGIVVHKEPKSDLLRAILEVIHFQQNASGLSKTLNQQTQEGDLHGRGHQNAYGLW